MKVHMYPLKMITISIFIFLCMVIPAAPGIHRIPVRVQSALEGDLIRVIYGDREVVISLIGIDAPEIVRCEKAVRVARSLRLSLKEFLTVGKMAKRYCSSLMSRNDKIFIEFDSIETDMQGRLLCYVYLTDGSMVNELLVSAGFAYPVEVPPNTRYRDRFRAAQREAIKYRRGLWR